MQDYLSSLSVGLEYDYPLLGGEWFYDLIPIFNEKFGLELNRTEFENKQAYLLDDGKVGIEVVSYDDAQYYRFVNESNEGVIFPEYTISFQPPTNDVIQLKPVAFEEELEFIKGFPLDKFYPYIYWNNTRLEALFKLLIKQNGSYKLITYKGERLKGCTLRYYGEGTKTPSEFGTYENNRIVCVIDIPYKNEYRRYCLKTENDYGPDFRN